MRKHRYDKIMDTDFAEKNYRVSNSAMKIISALLFLLLALNISIFMYFFKGLI